MRVKRWLKILGLWVGGLVVLLLLSILAFVFNPLEGSLASIRDVVPRNVDFFLRKRDLADDIARFPEPKFWEELSASRPWRELSRLPTVAGITAGGGIQRAVDELRRMDADLRSAQLDVLADALGTEVLLAGRLTGSRVDEFTVCAYTRVRWKVRAAWGLLGYGFAQDMLREQGIAVAWKEDILEVQPQGAAQPMFVGRHLDCLMIANDLPLLQASLALARGGSAEPFGTSSTYIEGIERPLAEWQKITEVAQPNTVELFADLQKVFERTTWDDRWPNPTAKDSMNERVLASFLNLAGWKFVTGSLVFEGGSPSSLTLLARVAMNVNLQTPFQRNFFKAEESPRRDWLNPFLTMVPKDAFAACGMRMPAGDFLREMYRAMDPETQDGLNKSLRSTGTYQTLLDLIDKIEIALLPRTGFVFRRNLPDPEIPVADPSPVPQVAWVFWLRPAQRKLMDDLLTFMRANHRVLGFAKVYANPIVDARGDVVSEFTNPQINGTGMLAGIVFDEFFVIGNSGPLIRDMFKARLGRIENLITSDDLIEFDKEIPNTVNGFAFVQGRQLEELLLQYDRFAAEESSMIDPGWAAEKRPGIEADVFRRDYAREATTPAALRPERREQLNRDVDARMQEEWGKARAGIERSSRASTQEMIAVSRMFRSAYFQVTLDPESIRLSARAMLQYR